MTTDTHAEIYFIVYPSGDTSKLAIVSLDASHRYEMDEYKCASRTVFDDRSQVIAYARTLSQKHHLPLSSCDSAIQKELDYLD